MALSKSDLLAKRPVRVEAVEVPELGGTVHVRVMSASQREAYEIAHRIEEQRNFRARMIVATVCDEGGSLLFEPSDIPEINQMDANATDRLVNAALAINKVTADDVEEAAKN